MIWMSNNPYEKFFSGDGETEPTGGAEVGSTKVPTDECLDDFFEDRLQDPKLPEVGQITTNQDGTTEKVISVKREILLAYWKCLSCYQENDGNQKKCTQCRTNRPLNVEFYLKDDSTVITNEQKIQEALSGPDWQCTVCSTINDFNSRLCNNCNTDQNLGGDVTKSLNAVYNDSAVPERDHILENREDVLPSDEERKTLLQKVLNALPPLPSKSQVAKLVGSVGVVIALCVGGKAVASYYITRPETAKIETMERKRIFRIEKYVPVMEESWDTYPSDAFDIKSERRIYRYNKIQVGTEPYQDTEYRREKTGTKQVQRSERIKTGTKPVTYADTEYGTEYYTETGYETRSLGNGTYERVTVEKQKSRSVPKSVTKTRYEDVYDIRYYTEPEDVYENVPYQVTRYRPVYEDVPEYKTYFIYKVNRRQYARNVEKSGTDNHPKRPEAGVDFVLSDKERIGSKNEDYDICVVTETGKKGCLDVDNTQFTGLSVGNQTKVRVNGKGKVIDLSTGSQ